jgi:Luciferase-like monooxygenase
MLAPVRASGRDIDVSPAVLVCVDDNVAKARDMSRPWLAIYLGGMGAKGKNFYVETAERMGHGDSARRVQELFMAGDPAGAGAAISDEIIDACAICCRAPHLDDRLAAFERAGADTLLAMPFGDRPRIVEALAAAARGAAA